MKRKPDFVLPGYLNRWYLIPHNRWFNIYLHEFVGPDNGEHPHDHPWWNLTVKLKGDYKELSTGTIWSYFGGRLILRMPETVHFIHSVSKKPCWTLFITGPKVREWGFWVDGKWIRFDIYKKREIINGNSSGLQ